MGVSFNVSTARRTGSSLIPVLFIVIVLFGLSLALVQSTMTTSRTSADIEELLKAFYVADAGCQLGVAMIRDNPAVGDTTVGDDLLQGTVAVTIEQTSANLYHVRTDRRSRCRPSS